MSSICGCSGSIVAAVVVGARRLRRVMLFFFFFFGGGGGVSRMFARRPLFEAWVVFGFAPCFGFGGV